MRVFLTSLLVAVSAGSIWAVWLVSQTGTMGQTSTVAVSTAAGLAWLWHQKWK